MGTFIVLQNNFIQFIMKFIRIVWLDYSTCVSQVLSGLWGAFASLPCDLSGLLSTMLVCYFASRKE